MHLSPLRALAAALLLVATPAAAQAAGPGPSATEVTVTGAVQRIAIEPLDGAPVLATAVVPAQGPAVRVAAEDLADVATGAAVTVVVDAGEIEEQASADALDPDAGAAVLDVRPSAASEVAAAGDVAALSAPTTRTVHTLTATFPGQGAPTVTPARLMQDLTTAVAPYWADSTGGAVRFVAGTQRTAGTYGSWGSTSTCTVAQIMAVLQWAAEQAVQGSTVNTGRHVVLYTPNVPACGFAGVANVSDGGTAWLNGPGSTPSSGAVMAHELGHTLTLGHSNTLVGCGRAAEGPTPPCQVGAYGDAYDVMGWQSGAMGPLSGAQLDGLGLLDPASALVTSGPTVTTLAPVGSLSGRRFLVLTTGGERYHVEYRGPVGRDADLATARAGCPGGLPGCVTTTRYVPGVLVHRVDDPRPGGSETLLLDAGAGDPAASAADPRFVLQVGRSFTTADRALTVTVEQVTASGATVRVVAGVLGTAPRGAFDAAAGVPGGARVSGWALDPKTTAPSYVWVQVGTTGALLRADGARADVAAAFPTYGSAHGFSGVVPGPSGPQLVCVTAVDVAGGRNTSLGCRSVVVPATAPIGAVDSVVGVSGGVRTRGWALDPQTTASSYVVVDVDGVGRLVRAGGGRADVGRALGLGTAHGFDVSLPAAAGTHRVCVTAVEVGIGPHTPLGCRAVVVPDTSPLGRVEAVRGVSGGLTVSGWALDPDTTASTWVWVDVDGRDGRPVLANVTRTDVGAAFPGAGTAHGFRTTVTSGRGAHTVCVTAVNTGAGADRFLGCASAVVP